MHLSDIDSDIDAALYAEGDAQETGGGTDWTGLVEKAFDVWGRVETSKQQAEVAKAQAQYAYRYPTLASNTARLPGGTLTYPSLTAARNGSILQPQNDTLLMLLALGVIGGAFILTRK